MDIQRIIKNYKEFYGGKRSTLIKVQLPVETERRDPGYTSFDLNTWKGLCGYLDAKISYLEEYYGKREGLEDDTLPELFFHLGTGAGGAVFDEGEVLFTSETSWLHPTLTDYADMGRLDSEKRTKWAQIFLDGVEYIMEHKKELVVAPFMHYSPLDAANSLRGNEVFCDFYEYPEELKELLGYCTRVTRNFHRELMKRCGALEGGQSMWNIWVPGERAIGFMEDTSNLCSPDNYKQFGREYTAELVRDFGGGFIHNHMLGLHQFAQISSIDGLGIMNIANDPKCPRVTEVIAKIRERAASPIYFECTYAELKQYLGQNDGMRAVVWMHCNSEAEAKSAIGMVRERDGC